MGVKTTTFIWTCPTCTRTGEFVIWKVRHLETEEQLATRVQRLHAYVSPECVPSADLQIAPRGYSIELRRENLKRNLLKREQSKV